MAGAQKGYDIGQIIYILSNKSQSVVPAIIAEEDIRKVRKLDGVHEVVNYKLHIGPRDKLRQVDLNRIDGEVFTSLEDIRVSMVEKLTTFVDDLIKSTQGNVLSWYGVTADNHVLESNEPAVHGDKIDPEQLVNAVNNNMPIQQMHQPHPLQLQGGPQQPTSMVHNLRNMVGDNGMPDGGPSEVIMPDGTRMKVSG